MHPISKRITGLLCHPSKRSAGAILLSGPWGCGKTYLWNAEISKSLEEVKVPSLYISLFGVTSADEIKSRLVTSWLKASVAKRFGADQIFDKVEKFSEPLKGVFTTVKDYVPVLKNLKVAPITLDLSSLIRDGTVICFDDLERASMATDAALGFINGLVEQKQCKVLLIANEEHLRDQSTGSTIYEKYKEKVVWTSLKFEPKIDTVFDIFLTEAKTEALRTKLNSGKPLILDVFRSAGSTNLRTLHRVLRSLEEIYELCDFSIPDDRIRFLVALLIEDARNGLKGRDIYNPVKFRFASYNDKRKAEELNGDDKTSYEFYTTYYENRSPLGRSDALYDFVRVGTLDVAAFRKEVLPDEGPKTEQQRFILSLREPHIFFQSDKGERCRNSSRCIATAKSL